MTKGRQKIRHKQADGYGNELRVYSADQLPHVLTVKLFIRKRGKARTLGIINKITRKIFLKRERNKHLHENSRSYGINYTLLSQAKQFDTVVIRDEVAHFEIPKDDVISRGQFLYFKEEGFEKQIFVSLEALSNYCVREKMF